MGTRCRWIRILLGVGLLISGVAAAQKLSAACGACHMDWAATWIPLAGVLFYGALLAAALRRGPSGTVFRGVAIAAGVHGGLVAHLIGRGILCPLCLAAAANAAALLIVACSVGVRRGPGPTGIGA